MSKNLIIELNSYLILFLPIALITGPFLADLIVVLSIIFFIFYFDKKKFRIILNNKLFYFFLSFWLISITSSILSKDIFFSLKSSLFYFRFIFFFFIIFFLLNLNNKILKKFLYVLIFIFVGLFLDSLFQKYYGFNIIGIKASHDVRISSFFGDELIMGSFMVKFYPLLIGLLYLFYKKRFQIIFSVISITTLITVFFSAEKTAIVVFFIEYFLIVFFMKKDFKTKILNFLIPVILFFALFFSFPKIKFRIYDQLLWNSINFKFIFTEIHHQHYTSAYRIFKDHPIIGIGPKMFRKYCSKDEYRISNHSCTTHPHNFSIQLLSETGIFGFLAFISFYFIFVKDFIKLLFRKEFNEYYFPLITSIILNLVNFMPLFPSGNFFNNWLGVIYSIPIGFYLYFKSKVEKN